MGGTGGGGDWRRTLAPGATFPDLELPDHVGNPRALDELVGDDPLVLHFYRGWWCPKEQAYFRQLVALQDEAEVAYTRFVSVSVDPWPVLAAFRAGLGARWTFLSDEQRTVLPRLGLLESTDTLHHPYQPAIFVLRPGRCIHAAYDGYWYWGRPTAEELRLDLRSVTEQIRPDFALPSGPGR